MAEHKDPAVHRFIVGPLGVNCYVVADPDTKEACVIDPGADGAKIKDYIRRHGMDLKFIINTHGHGDHIAANRELGAPVYIHEDDKDCLVDPRKNLSAGIFMFDITSPEASKTLRGGETVKLGSIDLKVIHTPGHTKGSISILAGNILFTGDTLFHSGIGRTDLPGGSEEEILRSIKDKLLIYRDGTQVCPGHGGYSTIGQERGNF